jgi:multidrug efflux pump subunit AcrA (membrane-fusion protein)
MSTESNGSSNKIIIAILILAIIGSWIYFNYSLSNTKTEMTKESDTKIAIIDSAKKVLQSQFDAASIKVDSLTASNTQMSSELQDKTNEIVKLKSNIGTILKKKNATEKEIEEAKKMIAELNNQISSLATDLAKAQAENKELNAQNQNLTAQNTTLNTNLNTTTKEKERIQDIASTLHASSFNIEALRIKDDGTEKKTNNTRRANAIRISFQIDKNKITPTGTQDLYICIAGPDGNTIADAGTLSTREDGQKKFANKMTVKYEQNSVLPISYDIKQASKFTEGEYKIEVYNNGFKIGEGKTAMKKSLF